MLLYGEPKVGKTTHASMWPAPLFLDFDEGLQAFAGHDVRRVTFPQESLIYDQEGNARVETELSWPKWQAAAQELLYRQALNYETIVVDTLSAAQHVCNTWVTTTSNHQAMERQDWGTSLREMQAFIDTLFSLPTHILVLCHAKEFEGEGGLEVRPDLAGQLGQYVERRCDVIAHLRAYMERSIGEDGRQSVLKTVRIVSFVADRRVAGNRCRIIAEEMMRLKRNELTIQEMAELAKRFARRDLKPANGEEKPKAKKAKEPEPITEPLLVAPGEGAT
jgi:cytochrome c553